MAGLTDDQRSKSADLPPNRSFLCTRRSLARSGEHRCTMGRRNNKLARIIAEQIEQIRAQVYESLFPPSEKVDAVSIIRVCTASETP